MKLGILQGRLSPPINFHIQNFPEDWEREFELIDQLGLDFIEWLVNTKSFNEGKLNIDCKKYSDKITSISCDNLTNENIVEADFLEEQLKPVCYFALRNNIKNITIPLLEKSKIDHCVDKFLANIEFYTKRWGSGGYLDRLHFNFELESDYDVALEICKSSPTHFITYDIGNITACGFDHERYLTKCIEYINTVHIKDKTLNPVKNVELGTGNADFDLIFKVLSDLKYNDKFTLQTNRGEINKEVETIQRHKSFFEILYKKYFKV